MLAGKKSLAMFYAYAHELPSEELIPEEAFSQYVQSGKFLRHDLEFATLGPTGNPLTLQYVFYAPPSDEWRIKLMTMLKRAFYKGGGWNETCERIEGTLIGYSDAENDAHCEKVFKKIAQLHIQHTQVLNTT